MRDPYYTEEDIKAKICPRCGAVLHPADVICPLCETVVLNDEK